MAFVNEVPTEHDIEKYGLPYGNDKNFKPELRRIWTADHDRDFYLTVGVSGKPEHDEELKWRCTMFLNGTQFRVFVMPGTGSLALTDNPVIIHYGPIESIWVVRADSSQSVPLPKSAWDRPGQPQSLLDGRSFDEFVAILKEGLGAFKAGNSNRKIRNPIVVRFDF